MERADRPVRLPRQRPPHENHSLQPELEHFALGDGRRSRRPAGRLRSAARGRALLPPCSPTKIVCVGRNYAEHAKEMGVDVPAEPTIFLKPPSSLIAAGDAIVYPRLTQRLDYEGELGVVMDVARAT